MQPHTPPAVLPSGEMVDRTGVSLADRFAWPTEDRPGLVSSIDFDRGLINVLGDDLQGLAARDSVTIDAEQIRVDPL